MDLQDGWDFTTPEMESVIWMPLISKPSASHTGTLSPSAGDFLNTLLVVKDTVNTTLLHEHTRLADLSNSLCEVEDQIRNASEQTIRNLKTEFEKRRKKIVPGIKRLQDSLKSLSKSESRCKISERACKNADVKKAKRRIRDAQKTLQDFTTPEMESGLRAFLSDQISLLCQQLIQIPPKCANNEVRYEFIDIQRTEKTDSDSEGSSRVNTPTNHIYAEIDVSQPRKSTYLTPRRSTRILSEKHHSEKNDEKLVPCLYAVDLFSSDSEDDYGFGSPSSKHLSKIPKSSGSDSRQSRSETKNHSVKSQNHDYEILANPTELFRGSASTSSSPSRVNRRNVSSPSPGIGDEYEKPLKREQEGSLEQVNEYLKRMSPAFRPENENTSKQLKHEISQSGIKRAENSKILLADIKNKDNLSNSTVRSTHKRLLPATPKDMSENKGETMNEKMFSHCHSTYLYPKIQQDTDNVDAGLIEEKTIDLENPAFASNTYAAQKLLDGTKILDRPSDMNSDTERDKIEPETYSSKTTQIVTQEKNYIDLEELKFRETVRSARREIIDKLKRKYAHSTNTFTSSDKDDKDENDETSFLANPENKGCSTSSTNDLNLKLAAGNECTGNPTESIDSSHLNSPNNRNHNFRDDPTIYKREQNSGLHRSKLVYTYDMNSVSSHLISDETPTDDSNSLVTSKIKLFEMASAESTSYEMPKKHRHFEKYGVGARNRSASETRTTFSSFNDIFNSFSKTIQPKSLQPRYGKQNVDHCKIKTAEISNNQSSTLTRSCTENDLLNLVRNESSSSIRRQWSKRRSSSMTPKISDNFQKPEPAYEYWLSFLVPEQSSRCLVSAIVVLNDMSIIVLDERHCFLHLYDRVFKHKDQYRLLDIPRGCVKIKADNVATAFPYKKCICTYFVKMDSIMSGSEISVPCPEWIVDVAFSKNFYFVLCKAAEIHVMSETGAEKQRVSLGMTGIISIPPTANFIFIMGEGRVSKFDIDGSFISSKADIDTQSMIYLKNRTYVADRQRHKLVPLSETTDVRNLIDTKIEYPSAICTSLNGDIILVSQFEESMDLTLTRTVKVFRLKRP